MAATAQPVPETSKPKRRRNPWIWVSAALALIAAGLLIWALTSRSDLDDTQSQLKSTQQELSSTQQELDTTKQSLDDTSQKLDSTTQELDSTTQEVSSQDQQSGRRAVLAGGAIAAGKALYDDLTEQLGATQEDLDATQQELEDANKKAEQAEKDAAAAKEQAKQAGDETDKAKAETEQAKAEADAAQSRATVVKDCTKAYLGAFGKLFEGDSVRDQAAVVRDEFSKITADCKTALAGS
jgi:peptidoglycan hydrolase CwlO-like protein